MLEQIQVQQPQPAVRSKGQAKTPHAQCEAAKKAGDDTNDRRPQHLSIMSALPATTAACISAHGGAAVAACDPGMA